MFEKFERRQPPSPKRGLSASRRVFKNQCADKGFAIADERRVRERQFALSCPPRSLVSRAQSPNCTLPRTHSGIRQDALLVIALTPQMIDAQTGQRTAVSVQRFSIANAERVAVTALRYAQQTAVLPAKELHV